MEIQGERLIAAAHETTRAALNDPVILKDCNAGCEALDGSTTDGFSALMAVKIGPVNARFKGSLKPSNVLPPKYYTLNFDGQGGIAGFGKGSADVALSAEGPSTRLKYHARAQVGGKLAQIGSRLIDAAGAEPPPPVPGASGGKMQWWVVGAAVVLAALYLLLR